MKIIDNSGKVICSNPIELTLENISKFQIQGVDCETLFKSNTIFDDKCGRYVVLKLIDAEYNIDKCEDTDPSNCDNVISFSSTVQRIKNGNSTTFVLTVLGSNDNVVEFKLGDVWYDANVLNNGFFFSLPNTGQTYTIQAKIKGCVATISTNVVTFNPEECVDVTWNPTGNVRCVNNISEIEEISNCNRLQWVIGGDACSKPVCCPTTFGLVEGTVSGNVYTVALNSNNTCETSTVRYGWSLTNNITTVTNWQVGNSFSVTTGTRRYFFFRMTSCSVNQYVGESFKDGVCVDDDWNQTAVFRCVDGFKQFQEISNCGTTRWKTTSSEPCDVNPNLFKVPVGVIRWDAWGTIQNPMADDYDLFKQTAYGMSQPWSEDRIPFFGNYVSPYTVRRTFCKFDGTQDMETMNKQVNVTFNGDTPAVMQQEIDYADEAGISYFLFNFYPEDAVLAYARNLFVGNQVDRKSIKIAYIAHYISLDHPLYNQSINIIGNQMKESYYQRIDGKPLLVLDGDLSTEGKAREYQKYLDIKAVYGGGELYVVYQSQYDSPLSLQGEINAKGYNSHTKYATFASAGPFTNIMDNEIAWYNDALSSTTVDFTPNITVSFENKVRQFEGCKEYWEWNVIERATQEQTEIQLARLLALSNQHPTRIKTIIAYSWNEYGEGGRTVSPQKRLNGTINRETLDKFKKYLKGDGTTPPTPTPCVDVWTNLSTFECVGGKKQYYQQSSCSGTPNRLNPVVSNDDCGTVSPGVTNISLYVAPQTQNDTLNLAPMFGNYTKHGMVANYGFASAITRGYTGKADPLKAGFDYMYDNNTYPTSVIPLSSASKFINTKKSENGNNGYHENLVAVVNAIKGTYPIAENFLTDNWGPLINSQETIDAIAQHYSSTCLDVGIQENGGFGRGGWCLFDEETFSAGFQRIQFFILLAAAVNKVNPNAIVLFYGFPTSNIWHDNLNYFLAFRGVPEDRINIYKNEDLYHLSGRLKENPFYVDVQQGYIKAPMPVSSSLFEKDGSGNYVKEGGKRKLRKDRFEEFQFGKKNVWRPMREGAYEQEPPGSGNYVWKTPEERTLRDNEGNFIPDSQFAVAGVYKHNIVNRVVRHQIVKAHGYGDADVSIYRDLNIKGIAVQSLLTEPFTFGQCTGYRRWVSENQIKWCVMATIFAGHYGVEFWETGYGSSGVGVFNNPDYPNGNHVKLPANGGSPDTGFSQWGYEGEPVINPPQKPGFNPYEPDNLSRFEWATKAVVEMKKILSEYTLDTTMRYLDFTHFGMGYDLREAIVLGIYQGNKCHLLFTYPWHDPSDTTTFEFSINGQTYSIPLVGRETKVVKLDGNFTGLQPIQFRMTYNTIGGEQRRVTGDPNTHNF